MVRFYLNEGEKSGKAEVLNNACLDGKNYHVIIQDNVSGKLKGLW